MLVGIAAASPAFDSNVNVRHDGTLFNTRTPGIIQPTSDHHAVNFDDEPQVFFTHHDEYGLPHEDYGVPYEVPHEDYGVPDIKHDEYGPPAVEKNIPTTTEQYVERNLKFFVIFYFLSF